MTESPTKVLMVDDEQAFLSSNAKLLKNRGYEVYTAPDGATALKVLAESDIAVVILDVKMPGMDGLSVLMEIKKRYPLVEVILLSGHATFEAAVEGLKIGAVDYLMKPCGIGELTGKIEEAHERRKINEEKNRYRQTTTQTGPADTGGSPRR